MATRKEIENERQRKASLRHEYSHLLGLRERTQNQEARFRAAVDGLHLTPEEIAEDLENYRRIEKERRAKAVRLAVFSQ